MTIAASVGAIRKQLEKNTKTKILAASKGRDAAQIREAMAAGITLFGENRVQEAESKWPGIKAADPEVQLHLIGPLQTNKAREAVRLFDVIQTLDRPALADALSAAMEKEGKRVPLYIQVNTGEEPQKAGVSPEELAELLAHARALGLSVVGLMCIPPADQPPAPHFALLRQLAKQHGMPELSMGMSEDYAVAARLGATIVRIGRALWERDLA